jgi:hypothetical protein
MNAKATKSVFQMVGAFVDVGVLWNMATIKIVVRIDQLLASPLPPPPAHFFMSSTAI